MKPLLIYLLLINAVGLVLMLTDKYKAKNNLWRIPERVLLWVAFFGGSLGSLLGMHIARHKTQHLVFKLLIPVFLLIHGILLMLIWK